MPRIISLLLSALLLAACTANIVQQESIATPQPATQTPLPHLKTPRLPTSDGTVPQLLAQISFSLAPGQRLSELLIDHEANRLYVADDDSSTTDTPDTLYVLDATTYTRIATITLAASGQMTYDPAHHRLYITPNWHNRGNVTVVDTEALKVAGTLSPTGLGVAVDPKRNRVYIGGRVYDNTTLKLVGELPKPGIPYYNPLRDEVYLSYGTVYRVDPTTLQITGDLMPEITPHLPGPVLDSSMCCGYEVVNALYIMPERNVIAVMHGARRAGGGLTYDSWTFFNATTLEQIEPPPTLSNYAYLTEPVDGLIYRGTDSGRYDGLQAYDSQGVLQDQREGLRGDPIVNPRTKQLYLSDNSANEEVLVLDLGTLNPVGTLPVRSIDTVDAQTGRLYAFDRTELLIFAERGQPQTWPNSNIEAFIAGGISRIHPSPSYATDHTLFASTKYWRDSGRYKLYRSTDGGQTWTQLNGGWVREGESQDLDLALSPQFATDRTLFIGGTSYGSAGGSWGEGVYRSTDGGDTWLPLWNGLSDLKVHTVRVSPLYAQDGTVLAYTGEAIFRSTDRGLSWSLALTRTNGRDLPPPEDLLPADPAHPMTRSDALPDAVLSPNFQTDRTAYKTEECDLLRTTDGGFSWTWQRAIDKRVSGCEMLEDRSHELKRTTALAVSALLDDGHYQLFIGRLSGKVLVVDPSSLTWEPVSAHATPVPDPALAQCSLVANDAFVAAYTASLGCPTRASDVFQAQSQTTQAADVFKALYYEGQSFSPGTVILNANGQWKSDRTQQVVEPAHYFYMKSQEFDYGIMFTGTEGEVYLLYSDSHWEKEAGW